MKFSQWLNRWSFCLFISIGLLLVLIPAAMTLMSDTFQNTRFEIAKIMISTIGACTGIICVLLLARRFNSGNVFGMIANVGECIGNFMTGNIGAGLPVLYYMSTHIYGLKYWKKNQLEDGHVRVNQLSWLGYVYILLAIGVCSVISFALTPLMNAITINVLSLFDMPPPEGAILLNDPDFFIMTLNALVFGIGVVAQFTMIRRYAISWILWIIFNVIYLTLQYSSSNWIFTGQYIFYMANSLYGFYAWKVAQRKDQIQTQLQTHEACAIATGVY